MQVELILWPAHADPGTPELPGHKLFSLKPSENPCVPCLSPHSLSPWCELNLKCISECYGAISNLFESLKQTPQDKGEWKREHSQFLCEELSFSLVDEHFVWWG